MFILILIIQPILWWLGKQYDKSNYDSKRFKQNQKELESLFNNSNSFLWSLDQIEKKVIVSRGIEEIFGYSSEEFQKNFELWISRTYPDDEEKVQKHYKKLLSGLPLNVNGDFFVRTENSGG